MDNHDRDALERALVMCRAESPARANQIDRMLQDQPWEEVAKFAAHCCQRKSLHLAPWEVQPMYGTTEWRDGRDADAARLLHQMLALGLSRYEPDPMAAMQNKKPAA